eukprot:403358721
MFSKNVKTISSYVRSLDGYGHPIQFTYGEKQQQTHQSSLGGILTILSKIAIGIYMISIGNILLNYQDINNSSNIQSGENVSSTILNKKSTYQNAFNSQQNYTLNPENFDIAIGISFDNWSTQNLLRIQDIERYISVEFELVEQVQRPLPQQLLTDLDLFSSLNNSELRMTKIFEKRTLIGTIPCDKSRFGGFKESELVERGMLNNTKQWFCPNVSSLIKNTSDSTLTLLDEIKHSGSTSSSTSNQNLSNQLFIVGQQSSLTKRTLKATVKDCYNIYPKLSLSTQIVCQNSQEIASFINESRVTLAYLNANHESINIDNFREASSTTNSLQKDNTNINFIKFYPSSEQALLSQLAVQKVSLKGSQMSKNNQLNDMAFSQLDDDQKKDEIKDFYSIREKSLLQRGLSQASQSYYNWDNSSQSNPISTAKNYVNIYFNCDDVEIEYTLSQIPDNNIAWIRSAGTLLFIVLGLTGGFSTLISYLVKQIAGLYARTLFEIDLIKELYKVQDHSTSEEDLDLKKELDSRNLWKISNSHQESLQQSLWRAIKFRKTPKLKAWKVLWWKFKAYFKLRVDFNNTDYQIYDKGSKLVREQLNFVKIVKSLSRLNKISKLLTTPYQYYILQHMSRNVIMIEKDASGNAEDLGYSKTDLFAIQKYDLSGNIKRLFSNQKEVNRRILDDLLCTCLSHQMAKKKKSSDENLFINRLTSGRTASSKRQKFTNDKFLSATNIHRMSEEYNQDQYQQTKIIISKTVDMDLSSQRPLTNHSDLSKTFQHDDESVSATVNKTNDHMLIPFKSRSRATIGSKSSKSMSRYAQKPQFNKDDQLYFDDDEFQIHDQRRSNNNKNHLSQKFQ